MPQPMRQFIQPDFQAQPPPQLDWQPWEQPSEQQAGGVKSFMNNMKDDEEGGMKDTAKTAAKAMGAASL